MSDPYADFQEKFAGNGANPAQYWLTLANAVMAAYNAYPSSQPTMSGFTVVDTIWAPETFSDPNNSSWPYVTMGFSAYSNDKSMNLVVLRGTVSDEEAGYDLYGWNKNTACMLPYSNPNTNYGDVKEDLYNFYTGTDWDVYTSLAQSFNDALANLAAANPGVAIIVVSHSLGGAFATLGIMDAYAGGTNGNCYLAAVSFGSLHVGTQTFVDLYNKAIPATFRCANLSDFVPSIVNLTPPTSPPAEPYVHVGMPVTFTWQKWDNWANHSMQDTYLNCIQNYFDVLYFYGRHYPC